MSVSVIIPALNEAASIGTAIESARPADVIVADGESRDGTANIAREHGARVVVDGVGRGAQLNAGAAAAGGELLLFLHADTTLPGGWQAHVVRTLADRSVAVGAFSLAIAGAGRRETIAAAGANLRSHLLGLPYGDQALFLRREVFDALGGFRPLPIMEDFDFVQRAKALGRVVTLPLAVETSPRRWRQRGPFRTVLINQLMLAGWKAGLPPERLARFYRQRARD